MKSLYKIEHVKHGKVHVIEVVATSEEEAKVNAKQKYGELAIANVKLVDVLKTIQMNEEICAKILTKIHQKTNSLVKLKVALLEYQYLMKQLNKKTEHQCFRVSYEHDGNLQNKKYIANDSEHAVSLLLRELSGENVQKEQLTVKQLSIPYQIQHIEGQILKTKANMDKELDTVAQLKRKVWKLENFKKLIA